VGDEKLAFIVRVCVPAPINRATDMFQATCVGEIAEDMSKDCPAALKKWPAAGTEYLAEQASGLLKFTCPPAARSPTITVLPPLSPFPTTLKTSEDRAHSKFRSKYVERPPPKK
jgi:hypothetical protein